MSTEENSRAILFLLTLAKYDTLNSSLYFNKAHQIKEWLIQNMWNGSYFEIGVLATGIIDNILGEYSDVQILPILALAKGNEEGVWNEDINIYNGLSWLENYNVDIQFNGKQMSGFSKKTESDDNSIWNETTLNAVVAYKVLGNTARANQILSGIKNTQDTITGSFPHIVANDGTEDTDDWPYNFPYGAVDATTSFIFATQTGTPSPVVIVSVSLQALKKGLSRLLEQRMSGFPAIDKEKSSISSPVFNFVPEKKALSYPSVRIIDNKQIDETIEKAITQINKAIGNNSVFPFGSENTKILLRSKKYPNETALVYENGHIRGYAVFGPLFHCPAYLYYLAVDPVFRGRGLGSFLLNMVLKYFIFKGEEKMMLHVLRNNPAGRFYFNTKIIMPELIRDILYDDDVIPFSPAHVRLEFLLTKPFLSSRNSDIPLVKLPQKISSPIGTIKVRGTSMLNNKQKKGVRVPRSPSAKTGFAGIVFALILSLFIPQTLLSENEQVFSEEPSVSGAILKKSHSIQQLKKEIYLRDLLKKMGYQSSKIPVIAELFLKIYNDVGYEWQEKLKTAEDTDSLKDGLRELMAAVDNAGYISHANRVTDPLIRLLVNGMNDNGEDIFAEIDHSSLSDMEKEENKTILVLCTANAQLFYIMLNLAGLDVKAVDSSCYLTEFGHVFLLLDFKGKNIFFDPTNGIIREVDNFLSYYEKTGSYWKLKESNKLDLLSLKLKYEKTTFEALNEQSELELLNYLCNEVLLPDRDGHLFICTQIKNNLAVAYTVIGKMKEAHKLLKKAAEMAPHYLGSYMNEGTIYLREGDLAAAENSFKKAFKENPSSSYVFFCLGELAAARGEVEKAFKYYKRSLEINEAFSQPYLSMANIYEILNMPEKAAQEYEKLGKWNQDDFSVFVSAGLFYYQAKKYEKALIMLEKAAEINPYFVKTYYALGFTYEAVGNIDKAIEAFQHNLDAGEKNDIIFGKLGIWYSKKGRHEEALIAMKNSLKCRQIPQFEEFWKYFGISAYETNDHKGAIDAFNRSIKRNFKDGELYLKLGSSYEALNDVEKAMDSYKKALKMNPGLNEANLRLAGTLYKAKRFNEAINLYKKYIVSEPSSAKAYFGLGMAYLRMGNKENALKNFKRAVIFDPAYIKEVPEEFKIVLQSGSSSPVAGQEFNKLVFSFLRQGAGEFYIRDMIRDLDRAVKKDPY